jgi:DNA invertase Pin-like site-specific DNA recombinase
MTAAPQVHHAPLCTASGSKLKGLMGRAPYPYADAAFRPIGRPDSADGGMPQNRKYMGLFVQSDAMHNYVIGLAMRPAASAKPRGVYHNQIARRELAMKRECPLSVGAQTWAYFRDSGGEGQERSVSQQLDFARGYSMKHGIHLTMTFADEARPGSTIVKRDALQDMLAKARQLAPSRKERHPEAPDGILFWDTRRLGRDQVDNAFIKADLRRRGFVLIFLSDDIPDVGDFTPVIEAFLDWKAEQDLKDIGRDAQRGLHDLARKGYHPGGFPPQRLQGGTGPGGCQTEW